MKSKSLWLAALIAAAILIISWATNTFLQEKLDEQKSPTVNFTVMSADGPVSLSDYRGKVLLLYFGYTYCPDICPTSLAATGRALGELSLDERRQVAMLFISVDPERDTPERLQQYSRFFDPMIVGATSNPEKISEIAKQFGVIYAKVQTDTAGGYVIDHSADTLILDPNGKLAGKIPHGATPTEILREIRRQLAEKTIR